MRAPILRTIARIVLLCLAPMALDGCVSIGIERTELADTESSAAVKVTIFEKPAARKKGEPYPLPIFSELFRVEGGGERSVARTMASGFELPSVPPGRYRLSITKRINEQGDVEALSEAADKTFDVKAGQQATLEVILRKVPILWIVLAAITIIVLVILSIDLLKDADLPSPPPLPDLDVALVITDISLRAADGHEAVESPTAVDVYPAPGSVVAARRVTANFLMSTPVDTDELDGDAVLALGSKTGEIPGSVSYRQEEQLVRFAPERDFQPGETITVTLDLAKVRSRDGRHGEGKRSTSFTVR